VAPEAADAAAAGGGNVSGPFCPQAVPAMAQSKTRALAGRPSHRAAAAATLIEDIDPILPTMPADQPASILSDSEYQALTQALLAGIEAKVDRWLQDDVIDIDSHRTGGLLELAFPNGSKLVVNTQPPLHEVWLAAKRGGFHYRHVGGRWLDTRDGSDFVDALSQHASAQAGRTLRFSG
jgi:CyaY protein